jgi:hypothetical protein
MFISVLLWWDEGKRITDTFAFLADVLLSLVFISVWIEFIGAIYFFSLRAVDITGSFR